MVRDTHLPYISFIHLFIPHLFGPGFPMMPRMCACATMRVNFNCTYFRLCSRFWHFHGENILYRLLVFGLAIANCSRLAASVSVCAFFMCSSPFHSHFEITNVSRLSTPPAQNLMHSHFFETAPCLQIKRKRADTHLARKLKFTIKMIFIMILPHQLMWWWQWVL